MDLKLHLGILFQVGFLCIFHPCQGRKGFFSSFPPQALLLVGLCQSQTILEIQVRTEKFKKSNVTLATGFDPKAKTADADNAGMDGKVNVEIINLEFEPCVVFFRRFFMKKSRK